MSKCAGLKSKTQSYFRKKNVSIGCFILLFTLTIPTGLFSQSKASDWFKTGVKSYSTDEKIQAFKNAIQLDPNLLEAYYYLGLAYKTKGMFAEAEMSLNKAYFKNPYSLNNELKTNILFELGKLYAYENKFEKAITALQGAKELSVNRNRGRISYQLGQLYLTEGHIEKALEELYEGRKLLPQNTKLFDELLLLAESKKILNVKYRESEALLNSERYAEAINLLKEIIQLDSDFKDVREKLQDAQAALQQANTIKKLINLYHLANHNEQIGKLAEAVSFFNQIVAIEPNYKNSKSRLQALIAELAEKSKMNLKANNQQLNQNKEPKKPAFGYNNSVSAEEEEPDGQAVFSTIEPIEKSMPDNSDTELINTLPQKPPTDSNLVVTDIETLYQKALFALQNGDWQQAVQTLEKVQLLDPGYKKSDNNLADARFNLNKNSVLNNQKTSSNGKSTLFIIGSTISVIFLPIFGFLCFSPATRAKIYFLQGKLDKSASIYEKLLLKDPGKIKLYPLLANIYLLNNRRDENALKVFEMILKLNIYTKKRKEINSIMAKQYLLQGRTDVKAIQTMERELHAKIKTLNHP